MKIEVSPPPPPPPPTFRLEVNLEELRYLRHAVGSSTTSEDRWAGHDPVMTNALYEAIHAAVAEHS